MIIENYMKFIEDFLVSYYKIILGNQYDKKIITLLIEKYIDVRYYNNSIYSDNYSLIDRLNKELKNIAEGMVKEDRLIENKVKKIFTLFGYILYIDDCSECDSINSLVDAISNDNDLDNEKRYDLKELLTNFVKSRKKFFSLFDAKNFDVKFKRCAKNLKKAELNQTCRFSPIYSEWAIDKAYQSVLVTENKQYLLYLMLSGKILKNTIEFNYNQNYLVDFATSLLEKEKKINRYFKLLDNRIVKPKINILFDYKTYLEKKDLINSFINKGFNIAIMLDETYDNDLIVLDLFSYVFVYEKYEYYDDIVENKEKIRAKIVSL